SGEETGYGYGWAVSKVQGSKSIEHGGGIFGFLTNGIYLPGEDIYVIVLSNCTCHPPNAVSL
ncbi:MAG: serine hydrolase, partial [Saprospiraceae bacterium]|nr:serine hydrolase [Saprospiraceae bacterium]